MIARPSARPSLGLISDPRTPAIEKGPRSHCYATMGRFSALCSNLKSESTRVDAIKAICDASGPRTFKKEVSGIEAFFVDLNVTLHCSCERH